MSRIAFWLGLVVIAGLVIAGAPKGDAFAAPLSLTVPLTGTRQVPPVQRPAAAVRISPMIPALWS